MDLITSAIRKILKYKFNLSLYLGIQNNYLWQDLQKITQTRSTLYKNSR